MSWSGIVGWNEQELLQSSSGKNEFSQGYKEISWNSEAEDRARTQRKLESHKIANHTLSVSLCISLPLSFSLSLQLHTLLSLLLLFHLFLSSFCRTTPAFSWLLLINDFGFLVFLPCHGSKLGFEGFHMTRGYYHLNKVHWFKLW